MMMTTATDSQGFVYEQPFRVSKRSPKYTPARVRYAPSKTSKESRARLLSSRFEDGRRRALMRCPFALVTINDNKEVIQSEGNLDVEVVYISNEMDTINHRLTEDEIGAAFPGLEVVRVRMQYSRRDRDGRSVSLVARIIVCVTLASIRLRKLGLLTDNEANE